MNHSTAIPLRFTSSETKGLAIFARKENFFGKTAGVNLRLGQRSSTAFWQPRFYDFNVWSKKKMREKLHYMHRNPVDRKIGTASARLAMEQLELLCQG